MPDTPTPSPVLGSVLTPDGRAIGAVRGAEDPVRVPGGREILTSDRLSVRRAAAAERSLGAPDADVALANTALAFAPGANPVTPFPADALLWPRTPVTPTPVTPRLLVPFACAKTPDLVVPPPFEMARTDVAPLQVTEVEAVVALLTFLCTASGSFVPRPRRAPGDRAPFPSLPPAPRACRPPARVVSALHPS